MKSRNCSFFTYLGRLGIFFALATAGSGARWAGAGEPTVLLRQKFEPGTEWIYAFRSVLEQEIRTPGLPDAVSGMTLTGTVSQTAVGVDARSGQALIGGLGRSLLEIRDGPGRVQVRRDQTWLAAYRADSRGTYVRRVSPDSAADETLRRLMMNQIGEGAQICAAFPEGQVPVGAEWSGEVTAPMPWGRQPADGLSKLAETYKKDGVSYGVIQTRVTLKALACPGYLPDIMAPHVQMEGTSEGHLDLERGIWTRMAWDLSAKLEGRGEQGFEGDMRITSETTLKSAGRLSADEARVRRETCETVDRALSSVYAGNVEQGIKLLAEQAEKETDDVRRRGLESALALLDGLRRKTPDAAAREPGRGDKRSADAAAMEAADRAAFARDWEQAVKGYELLVKKYPNSDLAGEALGSAATILERHLKRPEEAGKLRGRRLAALEKKAASDRSATGIYRLAAAYAEAGNSEKAVAAYRRLLRESKADDRPDLRVQACYRLAGLLERLGKKEEAKEVYRAMETIPAEDEYSRKLKEKAKEKLQDLSAAASAPAGGAGGGPPGGHP